IDVVSVNSSNQLEITLNNRLTKYTVTQYENVELSSNRLIIKNLNYFNLISVSDTNLNTLWNNVQSYITTNQVTVDNVDSHISGIRNLTSNIQTENNQNLTNFVSSVTYSNNSFNITLNNNCKMDTKNLNNIQVNNDSIIMSNFTFYTDSIVTPPDLIPKPSPDSWFTWSGTLITGLTDIGKQQTDFVIPANASIQHLAFQYNKNVRKIDMRLTKVTKIAESSFEGCINLLEFNLPYTLQEIGSEAFWNCISLKNINIPNGVSKIGFSAFERCKALQSITIPPLVTTIENSTFYECKSLSSVTLYNSVQTIGERAFNLTESLKSINLPDTLKSIPKFTFAGSGLTSIVIPNSVSEIGEAAFLGCNNLESITLPNSLKTIGQAIFRDTKSLKSITIPSLIRNIPKYAFAASGLTSIVIPDLTWEIWEGAFSDCNNLESVTIPTTIDKIDIKTFQNCVNLTEINLGNVSTIETSAFSNCQSLSNIYLPNSLRTIKQFAFANCTSFRTITLPNSISFIGLNAFSISEDGTYKPLPNLTIYVNDEKHKQLLIQSGFNIESNIIIGSPSTLSIKREDETLK
ncbi:MAG: leucine-rich repeat domain-containing protein, partial [Ureaplasma sp.]|nr:leucine-rich repeat domain-containing protein [Ureaplasma sp.]